MEYGLSYVMLTFITTFGFVTPADNGSFLVATTSVMNLC